MRSVGQRIAAQSGMAARPGDYTVTLLNSNVNNAFAVPGGYVYVTRQLVALMNNEAELAFVMGHEVGHVAARHSTKRQTRSGLAGLGAALLGAVTGSDVIGRLAGTGAQLYSLGYSRSQENEADSLGVRYLAKAGYDPAVGGDILRHWRRRPASMPGCPARPKHRVPAGFRPTRRMPSALPGPAAKPPLSRARRVPVPPTAMSS